MNSMSYLFFGLMLVPLIIFLFWIVKQDKKRNYIGLAILVVAILFAAYVAINVDLKYMGGAQ
jgi:FtsH-binding integral membrane protein